MSYLVLKTIHLISVIAWFAGLFYVGRLFIYFNEAKSYEKVKKKILQDQFLLMTKRCMYIITWPSLILSTFFGLYMLHIKFSDFKLRLWNEFATLLLISIVSLAVLKTAMSWLKASLIFLVIGILLFSLIKIYRSYINSEAN